MSATTQNVHQALLEALGAKVRGHSNLTDKPLLLDLAPPLPGSLRVYAYNLVSGKGTKRSSEYKVVLRVPGQRSGEYGSFLHTGERVVLVVGVGQDLNVFVLWDASLHARFMYAGNLQVHADTVRSAAVRGVSVQQRRLQRGVREAVIACRGRALARAIELRVLHTGPVLDGEWDVLKNSI